MKVATKLCTFLSTKIINNAENNYRKLKNNFFLNTLIS